MGSHGCVGPMYCRAEGFVFPGIDGCLGDVDRPLVRLWRFYEIPSPEERMGDGGLLSGSRLFCDFMDSQSLRDVPISSASFTWSNMQSPPIMSKLDRFLLFKVRCGFPFSKSISRATANVRSYPTGSEWKDGG